LSWNFKRESQVIMSYRSDPFPSAGLGQPVSHPRVRIDKWLAALPALLAEPAQPFTSKVMPSAGLPARMQQAQLGEPADVPGRGVLFLSGAGQR
jgi:hypothetical protein